MVAGGRWHDCVKTHLREKVSLSRTADAGIEGGWVH